MENIFDYRNLLEITKVSALFSGLVATLCALGWFALPIFSKRGSAVATTSEGLQVKIDSDGPSGEPKFLLSISRMLPLFGLICFLFNLTAQTTRYFEVQHWPAQTMYEVIPLGTVMGFLSCLILYYVLGLQKQRGMARGFSDLFLGLIFLGAWRTLVSVLAMDPTGRALPPALQSYWFSTHITAYMFGYFTLFIATAAAWLFFCFKFWRGLFDRQNHQMTRLTFWGTGIFALTAIPFGQMGMLLGPGVLLITGAIAVLSFASKSKMAWFDGWEKGSDRFTWLIFVVGFPFLTAGLIQGGLWAQEAWALYWGWDSKEVSALISWIFYLVYLHLRYVAGWRGEKGMWILAFGGLSVYITFQLFGLLPASQSSLHRYTDMESVPAERLMEP
jgi:ABC-type transport system involved in cytochrome c biogenesis permease subunit